jgi:hypothetical protein
VDTQLLEVRYRQWRGQVGYQHIILRKGFPQVLGHGLLALPIHRIREEVFRNEGSACLLPSPVRLVVVWGREAEEMRGVGEGYWS